MFERCAHAPTAAVPDASCRTPLRLPSDQVPLYVPWEQYLPTGNARNVTFVQIGANCGANNPECAAGGDPVWAYAAACGWRGVAIEPVARTFLKLCKHYARLTPLVTPLRALVSDRTSSGGLVSVNGELSHAYNASRAQQPVRGGAARVERVPTVTLADVWPREHVPSSTSPLVLVVDVEGSEEVLLGHGNLPTPLPDLVLFESVHLPPASRAVIHDNLSRQGYVRAAALRHNDAVARSSTKHAFHDWLYARRPVSSESSPPPPWPPPPPHSPPPSAIPSTMARRTRSAAKPYVPLHATDLYVPPPSETTSSSGGGHGSTHATELVMALAWGYNVASHAAFLGSLRRTGYRGDILLFEPAEASFAPPSAGVLATLARYRARLQRIALPRDLPIAVGRFAAYARACRGGGYTTCLAADFRDTLFQADPFIALRSMHPGAPDLLLPLETKTIAREPSNSLGIVKCYGDAALALVANRTVVCSGVLLGSPDGFDALSMAVPSLVRSCHVNKGSAIVRLAKLLMADQAALNLFAYTSIKGTFGLELSGATGGVNLAGKAADGRPLRVAFEAAGEGVVHTVGVHKGARAVGLFESSQMHQGTVLNHDGRVSPIIHQYDRLLLPDKISGPIGLRFAALSAAVDEEHHSEQLKCRFGKRDCGGEAVRQVGKQAGGRAAVSATFRQCDASSGKATELICE